MGLHCLEGDDRMETVRHLPCTALGENIRQYSDSSK